MKRLSFAALGALILLSACREDAAPRAEKSDTEEAAFVRAILSDLQAASFAENREYCGVVGFDSEGHLVSSPISRGDEGSCLVTDDGDVVIATASFHTHGGFSEAYSSEVPSVDDLEGDEAEGIDGYVATPGGRFWFIDTAEDVIVASQLCSIGCLPSDPAFIPGRDGDIPPTMTYDEIVEFYDAR